ncbi:GNAT family N-acetyltransferase [Cellulophaga lytica]|uniref:GNAT family N-acetyltransferase n=1 Tax=Cellulophaga lytica TaxID=979 RepID=UPI0026E1B42D|nr:GNAT family N-acetyltransferase [Cellulophaga lytica]MDO6853320.1 GNAT family N-acetyltransferase [Cellulophaga lytica]
MIQNNPFLCFNFLKKWMIHFSSKKKEYSTSLLPDFTFIKTFIPLLYTNIAKTNTKGLTYTINNKQEKKKNSKTFLIYDIHTYFNTISIKDDNKYKIKKTIQYPGYLCELENFLSVNEYMKKRLSKSSNYKFNLYKRKLEHSFEISYKMYYGAITKEKYNFLFYAFKKLLIKRFNDKQETNNNLNPKEWDFYFDVTYPMLLEKKAALFVTYNKKTPIAITLLYFSDTIAFDTIRVFDIDYAPFRLGTISIIKQLDWCITNGIKFLDFSKGYYEYKERWATTKYNFEYHIIYNSKSYASKTIMYITLAFFNFKNYLRNKNIHKKFHQFTFALKKNSTKKIEKKVPLKNFKAPKKENLKEISVFDIKNTSLLKYVYDFLYRKSEKLNHVTLYKITNHQNCYYIKGLQNADTFTAYNLKE